MKKKFIFSLGQAHKHVIPGTNKVWDRNSVIEVTSDSLDAAESRIRADYDDQWSMVYEEKNHDPSLFPGGIVHKIKL